MRAFIATTLAIAGTAMATPTEATTKSAKFQLVTSDNSNLTAWAIVNAHIAAGQNVIEIQRPSAYVSDVSYLNGTASQIKAGTAQLAFDLKGVKYPFELIIPTVADGKAGQVYSEPSAGTKNFGLDSKNRLNVKGAGYDVFFACPQNVPGDGEVFTLWYGKNVKKGGLPSSKCLSIDLVANYKIEQ